VHKSVTKTFENYTEKLKSGDFYDGPLKFNKEKLHEFQIFVDCATELVQSSRKFILDYAKLKPEVFKLCDMSLLAD
jgi:SET domain-containing protein